MKLRTYKAILLAIAISFLLSACGSAPTTRGVVPNDLANIESLAEDIIDFAPAGEWAKVNSDIAEIEKAWSNYQPQAVKDGAAQAAQDSFTESLARLKSAATTQNSNETLQAANDLSASVIELFELYNPVIPTAIGRLDVLERQIILDVANQNYTAASETLNKIKSLWEQVQPSILEHNGQTVAEAFSLSLATQEAALQTQEAAKLVDEAKNALEIVDALENLY